MDFYCFADRHAIDMEVTFSHLSSDVIGAQIALGYRGKAGPIWRSFSGPRTLTCARCCEPLPGDDQRLLAGGAYVAVETQTNKSGEIRGQIGRG